MCDLNNCNNCKWRCSEARVSQNYDITPKYRPITTSSVVKVAYFCNNSSSPHYKQDVNGVGYCEYWEK